MTKLDRMLFFYKINDRPSLNWSDVIYEMVNGKREKGLFINDAMESMTKDFGVKKK